MGIFDFLKRKPAAVDMSVLNVGDDQFEVHVLQRSFKQPVLVDFWAAWCAPCRMLGPTLEKVAADPASGVTLAKVDTEVAQVTAQRFNIRSIPHVMLMSNGAVIGQFVGVQSEGNIRRFLTEKLAEPGPRVRLKLSSKARERLTQAKQALKRGDGFTATLALREMESTEAQTLLPLAQLLWDISDGDALTGNDALDAACIDALEALEARQHTVALEHFDAAIALADAAYAARLSTGRDILSQLG